MVGNFFKKKAVEPTLSTSSKITGAEVKSSTPRQAVVIFPYQDIKDSGFGSVKVDKLVDEIDITDHIYSLSFANSKESASGNFSLIVGPSVDLKAILKPGDWLMIYQSQFGIDIDNTKGLICLGNVDRISKHKIIVGDSGKKVTTYRVEGRDFGKIFEKSRHYYNPYLQSKTSKNILVVDKGNIKVEGSPSDLLRSYFNIFYGDGTLIVDGKEGKKLDTSEGVKRFNQVQIPQAIYSKFPNFVGNEKGTLKNVVQIKIFNDKLEPEGYTTNIPLDKSTSNYFWDLVVSSANTVVNEIFTTYETDGDRVIPTVVLRKIPFRKGLYTSLNTTYVSDSEIVEEDLGISDHERINYIHLIPTDTIITKFKYLIATIESTDVKDSKGDETRVIPFIDVPSIERYGLRMEEFPTDYALQDNKKTGSEREEDKDLIERWAKELIEVWRDMTKYESGTIVIKPSDEPRNERKQKNRKSSVKRDNFSVGDNIYLEDQNKIFHIEGVIRTWEAPGSSTITLTLSRGVIGNPQIEGFSFIEDKDPNLLSSNTEDFSNSESVTFTKRDDSPRTNRTKLKLNLKNKPIGDFNNNGDGSSTA